MEIENHPKAGNTGGNLLEIHKKDLHIVLKHAAGLLVVGEELHLKKKSGSSLLPIFCCCHLIQRCVRFLFEQAPSSFGGHCPYSRL